LVCTGEVDLVTVLLEKAERHDEEILYIEVRGEAGAVVARSAGRPST